jgi:hypothetical protein
MTIAMQTQLAHRAGPVETAPHAVQCLRRHAARPRANQAAPRRHPAGIAPALHRN